MPGGSKAPGAKALRRIAAAAAALALAAPAAALAPDADGQAEPAQQQGPEGKQGARGKAGAEGKGGQDKAGAEGKGGQDKAGAEGKAGQKGEPAGPPKIAARAWILIDPRDGEVLASSAPERELAIASATKLMTARLALKELRAKDTLRAPPYQALAAESLLGLRAGEKMTVRDLLYALILESANDAAATLAQGVSGSQKAFVERMNREAQRLGLERTSYANPIGLDAPGNYSSAADLAELASVLLRNDLFARVSDSQVATLRSGDRPRRIDTRNTLLNSDPSADGVKTGHTRQAGYVLVGSATRDGTRLISVVLGARSEAARDAETEKLLDYGFSLYRPSTPVKRGEEMADPELDYRSERLALVAKRAIEVSAREGQRVRTRVKAPDEVSGEIAKGQKLGQAIVSVDGRPAGSTPLLAAEAVEAATLLDKGLAAVENPLILLPAGLIVILIGVLLAIRGRRPGPSGEPEPDPESPATESKRRKRRERAPQERTPEERRQMHEERMRRRRQRSEGKDPR